MLKFSDLGRHPHPCVSESGILADEIESQAEDDRAPTSWIQVYRMFIPASPPLSPFRFPFYSVCRPHRFTGTRLRLHGALVEMGADQVGDGFSDGKSGTSRPVSPSSLFPPPSLLSTPY
jgi:hypothetical protein